MVVRKRLDIEGAAMVFVTTTVVDWAPLFGDSECATEVIRQMEETLSYSQTSVCAYVLMPSHLHALLGFRQVELLSRTMQSFKSLSARRLRPMIPPQWRETFMFGDRFVMWRPRFDDLVIWSQKQFHIKADYIHNNPVKAGLATRPADYLYSSARDWETGESGLIKIDREWSWTSD